MKNQYMKKQDDRWRKNQDEAAGWNGVNDGVGGMRRKKESKL